MNSKTLIVLILACVATITYAHNKTSHYRFKNDSHVPHIDDDVWGCQHDHIHLEPPVVTEVDEPDYNPEGNDHSGRTLASYPNFRIYGYYDYLGYGSFQNYVRNQLIPPIIDYWSNALKIKYPVSGALRVNQGSLCNLATPSILRSGVNADFVYMITVDGSGSYVASSGACSMAGGTNRPLVGHTVISEYYMQATSDVLLHERNMVCIMHEVVHTLGWTAGMYQYWLDYQTGRTISNPTTATYLDGYYSVVLQAEPIRTMARNYFGCGSIAGAYLENTGGSGTQNTHFERRHFAYEAMTSGLIYQMQFSELTLGLLESTGWYAPDYSYSDPFFFGQGKGCGFVTASCSAADNAFSDLCNSYNRGCTVVGRGGGVCSSDPDSENCRFQTPQVYYDCDNPSAAAYTRLANLQSFGRGSNSKCFTGSLSNYSPGASTTYCFKYTCSGSGSRTVLYINVGGQNVQCNYKGPVGVSGYAGSIDCPDPVSFCGTVGSKQCPRGCMGRGTCNNGVCQCRAGYSGVDCAL